MKFKVGDRVVENIIGVRYGIIELISDTQDTHYLISYSDGEIPNKLWLEEVSIKLDIQYYRDKRLKKLLK